MQKNGFFIDFEGIDGSGKGTLMEKLRTELEASGRVVVMTKEPGGSNIGPQIRQLLFHDPTTHNMAPSVCDCLFLADHIQNAECVVKPALEAGKVVVSDRYAFSQYAYSVDRKLHPLIDQAYHALLGPIPDVIFLLCGTPEALLRRAQKRTDAGQETHQDGKRWNQVQSQRRIQDAYFRLLMPYPQTVVVDTDVLSPDELYDLYIRPAVLEGFDRANRSEDQAYTSPGLGDLSALFTPGKDQKVVQ